VSTFGGVLLENPRAPCFIGGEKGHPTGGRLSRCATFARPNVIANAKGTGTARNRLQANHRSISIPVASGGECMSCDRPHPSTTSSPSVAGQSADSGTALVRKRTWDACAGLPECEVPLAQLDSAVCFDDDYPEPIRYDAARRVLRYRGTMSHASFVRLHSLSRDRDYLRAMEQLFVASAPPLPVQSLVGSPLTWLGLAAVAVVIAAAAWFAWSRLAPHNSSLPRLDDVAVRAGGNAACAGSPANSPASAKKAPEGEAAQR
jgi:hypothetical protein